MKLACCWGSLLPPQSTIHLVLRPSQGQRSFNFLVDTAFSGYLSLQRTAIEELGLEYLGKGFLAQYFEVEISFYLCEAWVVTPEIKPVFQLT
ncbi:MAG: hypothetical protein ACE5R6_19940 [Candidatus Heimdallarchaeota archaeon]